MSDSNQTSRRGFIKSAAILTTAKGLNQSILISQIEHNEDKDARIGSSANSAVAVTETGKVRGYIRNGVFTYKGIPYGANTAGSNRFMPPQKPKPWTDVRNCLVYGPICPQRPNNGWLQEEYGFLYQWIDGFQDEDCLRLNVWTPALTDGKKRAVLCWIHGGGFFSGSSQEHPSYDGENLASLGDVVVVSINHRLNAFGFLDLSDYAQEYSSSANVGMLDIVAALQWIQDNIANFGGDKDNVTIFGQSGGGSKVTTLMAMPSAKGLFHKAISQSNSIVQVSTHAYASSITRALLQELGLAPGEIAQLHKIKPARLAEAISITEIKMGSSVPKDVGRAGLQPVVDGEILPNHPFDPVAPALSADIPFMVGTTRNEASPSIDNAKMEFLDEISLLRKLTTRFGESKAQALLRAFRKAHPNDKPVELLSYVSAQNPTAFLQATRKAAQKRAPVYLYMFSWHTKALDGRPRSFHCSEIPFVFNNTDRCENYTGATAEARALGRKMAMAWINFAKYGNPNHQGLPVWPRFSAENGAMMEFNTHCSVKHDPDSPARQLLEEIFYNKA